MDRPPLFVRLLLPLVMLLFGVAWAQTVATSPELIQGVPSVTLITLTVVVSAFLAHWLTGWSKGRLGTEGRVTQLLAGFFSAVIGGLLGWKSGAYGHGWSALVVALAVSLLTWLGADQIWKGRIEAAQIALNDTSPTRPTPASAVQLPQQGPSGLLTDVVLIPSVAGPSTPLPVPVTDTGAAPVPGDDMTLKLISLLTGALAIGVTPPIPGQSTALSNWVDHWLPKFRADVEAAGANLNVGSVLVLVGDLIPAANELTPLFEGLDRGTLVAVVGRFVLQTFAPPMAQAWLAPLLASGAFEGFIKAKYNELFPEVPVTDAAELPSGAAVTQ